MKKYIKIIIIAVIVILAFVFITSNYRTIEPVRTTSAKEAIELFNKYNLEGSVDEMSKLYSSVYLQSTGYTISDIEKILSKNRDSISIQKSEVISIQPIDENLQKATLKITATIDGKEQTNSYDYAIIKEEAGWSVSPDGIISCTDIDIPAYTKNELNFRFAKKIQKFDGTILKINVFNDSKNTYLLGSDTNKAEVVVETNLGTYTTLMDEQGKIDKNLNSFFTVNILDLEGEIITVKLNNVYELDKSGAIIEDTKQDITIYKK